MKNSLIDGRFKGNILFNYTTQLIGVAAGFVTVTLITRHAGIHTYGMVAMMAALAGVLTNLMTFRTNEAVVSFYKRGQLEDDFGSCRMALVVGMLLDLVMGSAAFLLMRFTAPLIAGYVLKNPEMTHGVTLFSVIVLANFLRGAPLGLLVAQEQFRLANSLTLVEQLLKMILLGAMLLMGVRLTFESIICAYLYPAVGVSVVVYLFPLYRLFAELRTARIPRGRISDYARFSLSTFLSSTLKAGNQNVDTVILGYLTNPANVGIYSLFRQFLGPIAMISAPFASQIYPRFTGAVARRRYEEIRSTMTHANRLLLRGYLLLSAVIVPALVVYGYWNRLGFTTVQYFTFGLMLINALILQQLWWCRPFSLAVDPNLSLRANLIYSISLLFSLCLAISLAGFIGVGLALTFTACIQAAYWMKCLRNVINA